MNTNESVASMFADYTKVTYDWFDDENGFKGVSTIGIHIMLE